MLLYERSYSRNPSLIPNEPAVKDKQMIFLIIFLHSFPARYSHFARASHASPFNWKTKKNTDCSAC